MENLINFSALSKESFIEDNAKQLADMLAPDDLKAPIPGKSLFNYWISHSLKARHLVSDQ